MDIKPTIVIDTREQTPWTFQNLPTVTATLQTGDYSLLGLEHLVAVERKGFGDLLKCIGTDRDRFKRELQRLRAYRFRMLVVEVDAQGIISGPWRSISRLKPAHVEGSLAAWAAQYGLPIWLCGTHEAGARFVERYLFQAARQVLSEAEAVLNSQCA